MTQHDSLKDPLLKRTINKGLEQVIKLDPESQSKLGSFAGKLVELTIKPIDQSIYIHIQKEQLVLAKTTDKKPDTRIEGTPSALFAMATNQHISGLASVTINGDATTGQFVADWLKNFKPDLEEALCLLIGDGPGYRAAEFLRGGLSFLQKLHNSLSRSSKDFLLQESRTLIQPHEIEEFLEAVDDLSSETALLEQRIQSLIQSKQTPSAE